MVLVRENIRHLAAARALGKCVGRNDVARHAGGGLVVNEFPLCQLVAPVAVIILGLIITLIFVFLF